MEVVLWGWWKLLLPLKQVIAGVSKLASVSLIHLHEAHFAFPYGTSIVEICACRFRGWKHITALLLTSLATVISLHLVFLTADTILVWFQQLVSLLRIVVGIAVLWWQCNDALTTMAVVILLSKSLAVLQTLGETLGFPRHLEGGLGWFSQERAGLRREEVVIVLRGLRIVLNLMTN